VSRRETTAGRRARGGDAVARAAGARAGGGREAVGGGRAAGRTLKRRLKFSRIDSFVSVGSVIMSL